MPASESFILCANGTLLLGFTQEAYPKLFYKQGRIVGYIEEFWRIVLMEIGCKRIQFVNYDSLLYSCTTYRCLTLLNGAVERNEQLHVFSNIPAMYFQHAEVFDYRYSMPLFWNELMLVEGRNETDRNTDNPNLLQFTVFQYDAFSLLVMLFIAVKIINYLFHEFAKFKFKKPIFFEWMELISASIVLVGAIFAITVYQSDFKGNAATVAVEAATSFAEMIKEMQLGVRKMILEDAATFTPQERQALFGRSTTVIGDTSRRIRAVCSDPSLVTMVYDQESLVMTTMGDLMKSCSLRRIAHPRENENPVEWLTLSLKGADYGQIGMPRATPRKVVDKVNEIATKLFNPDLNTGFWLRRYLPVHDHDMIQDLVAPIPLTDTYFQAALRPVSFSRIYIPFMIYLTIITLSIITFIIELVTAHFYRCLSSCSKRQSTHDADRSLDFFPTSCEYGLSMTVLEPFNLCPNGTLRLGYTAEAFPKTFFSNGRMIGYVAEFWHIQFGCERVVFIDYGYLSYSCHTDECLAMLDGAIQRNEVFTDVPSTYFTSDEVFNYRYSLPVFSTKLLLVQGRNITDDPQKDTSTLLQFSVFQSDAFILLTLLFLAVRIIEYLFRQFRHVNFPTQLSPSPFLFDLMSASLIIQGMSLLVIVYQSEFKGNAATWTIENTIPFAKILLGIQTGEKRMILDEVASFTLEEKTLLFGSTWTVVPDTATRIRTACADPTVVTNVYDQQSLLIANMKDINVNCSLIRVALPRANESESLYLSMTGSDVLQIGMPRETPSRIVERINEIAMKLYSWDLCNGFWLRRYIPARTHNVIDELVNAHNLPDSSVKVELRPVTLARLSIPFTILLIALFLCIISFVAEILIGVHCSMMRARITAQEKLISLCAIP